MTKLPGKTVKETNIAVIERLGNLLAKARQMLTFDVEKTG